jgi:hypothetical protein
MKSGNNISDSSSYQETLQCTKYGQMLLIIWDLRFLRQWLKSPILWDVSQAFCLLGSAVQPQDEMIRFFRNVSTLLRDYTELHLRRWCSSNVFISTSKYKWNERNGEFSEWWREFLERKPVINILFVCVSSAVTVHLNDRPVHLQSLKKNKPGWSAVLE